MALKAAYPHPSHEKALLSTEAYQKRLSDSPPADRLTNCDFEESTTNQLSCIGKGSSLSHLAAAAGKQSLVIEERAENKKPWMPLVNIPLQSAKKGSATGFHVSFDAMLDTTLPGTLSITIHGTDSSETSQDLATILLAKDGIRINTFLVSPMQPGLWAHIDLEYTVGELSDRMLSVRVNTENGDTWRKKIPSQDYFFTRGTDFKIISLGSPDEKAYLDNVVVTQN